MTTGEKKANKSDKKKKFSPGNREQKASLLLPPNRKNEPGKREREKKCK